MSATIESFSIETRQARRQGVPIVPLGLALSIFCALTFVLCAVAALIPGLRDIHILQALYPAFDWTRPELIAIGAIGAFACGWYIALVAGGLYNFFAARRA